MWGEPFTRPLSCDWSASLPQLRLRWRRWRDVGPAERRAAVLMPWWCWFLLGAFSLWLLELVAAWLLGRIGERQFRERTKDWDPRSVAEIKREVRRRAKKSL
jgi:hypothetical protein